MKIEPSSERVYGYRVRPVVRAVIRSRVCFALLASLSVSGCFLTQPAAPTAAKCGADAPPPRLPDTEPIEVAITFDGMPAQGPDVPGRSWIAIYKSIIDILHKHKLPPVMGFVDGKKLEKRVDFRHALDLWLEAGNLVGNHTYSAANLAAIGIDAYLADIDHNEPLLKELLGSGEHEQSWKVFRYPFLQEGTDAASRTAIREHLGAHGYRIAQVTIDFGDGGWMDPYGRCLASKNTRGLQALRESYVGFARTSLHWSVDAARQVFNRPIKHILVLHIGAFQEVVLDELLDAYEKAGVHFISLDEAIKDPVYATDPGLAETWGDSFLDQVIRAQKAPHPPTLTQPLNLLEALCR